jgi:hypothetical protein
VLDFVNWEVAWKNGVGLLGSAFKMDLVRVDASFMTVVVVETMLVVGLCSLRMFDGYKVTTMMIMSQRIVADRVC